MDNPDSIVVHDFNLFSLFIRHAKNVLSDLDCEKIKQLIEHANFKKHNAFLGEGVSTHSPIDDPIINLINQKFNIINTLMNYVKDYSSFYGIRNLKIDNIWLNIQKPGSTLKFHTHPMSIVSGVFYIDIDEKSSPIIFNNPNPFSEFIEYFNEPLHHTQFNYKQFKIIPSTGSLIMFPSWLKHGSEIINQSDKRVVLSFNTAYYDYSIPK